MLNQATTIVAVVEWKLGDRLKWLAKMYVHLG